MPKHLDEVRPNIAELLNPQLKKFSVDDIPKTEIRQGQSKQRQITNKIVGKVKRQLSGEDTPKPWFVYPISAIGATSVLHPINTIVGALSSIAGANAVDSISKKLTNKTWGENVENTLDINREVADFTNPGLLAGGLPFKVKNHAKAVKDVIKNNGTLYPNRFGKLVINGLKRLNKNKYFNTNNNIIENNKFLQLPYVAKNNKHYGNSIVLQSSNKTINLPDLNVASRRNLLKRINKIFVTRYGYEKLPLEAANTREATETAIKNLMTQHNSFVRGVRDKVSVRDRTNQLLIQNGLEPTKENRLRWYATHYAPDTGAGRANFYNNDDDGLGTIYTSNSFNVARGYADGRNNRIPGSQYVVQRPLDFSSPNLEDWVINNEFKFIGEGSTKKGTNYFDYELPYYLKTGKNLRNEYLKDNPIDINYNKISNDVAEQYFKDASNELAVKQRRSYLNMYKQQNNITFDFPKSHIGPNHYGVVLSNIEQDVLNRLATRKAHVTSYNKMIKDFLSKHPGYYTPAYYMNGSPSGRAVFKNTGAKDHMIKEDIAGFHFDGAPNTNHIDYSPELSKELSEFIEANKSKYLDNDIKGYYFGRLKHLNTEINNSKKSLKNAINKAIKSQYAKVSNIDISEYAKSKGLKPAQSRNLLFGDRYGNNVTINNPDNPWQHFVFIGPIDEEGLKIVRKIPYSEIEQYPSTKGGHIGPYTKGLSRKVKKYGGIKQLY